MADWPTKGRRTMMIALWIVAGALALVGGWLWWALVGSTPARAELRARLLALPKNAALRDRVTTLDFVARLDGCEVPTRLVHLRVPGSGDGPTIVLVHPTPHSLCTWTEVLFGGRSDGEAFEGLVGGASEIVALDVIGHGTTEAALPGPCTFQRCADWLGQALDALGLSGVCLVGQSYGGEFCWRLAADRPELVARLVLIDSAGVPRRDADWLPEERVMRSNGLAVHGHVLNAPHRIRGALQPHFRAPVPDDRVTEVFLACEHPAHWRAMVELCRDENGERVGDLRRVTQPTLLIWGAEDRAYEPAYYAQEFRSRLPDARLVEVPACGHYPQEERPAAVVAAIGAFLAERR